MAYLAHICSTHVYITDNKHNLALYTTRYSLENLNILHLHTAQLHTDCYDYLHLTKYLRNVQIILAKKIIHWRIRFLAFNISFIFNLCMWFQLCLFDDTRDFFQSAINNRPYVESSHTLDYNQSSGSFSFHIVFELKCTRYGSMYQIHLMG